MFFLHVVHRLIHTYEPPNEDCTITTMPTVHKSNPLFERNFKAIDEAHAQMQSYEQTNFHIFIYIVFVISRR